MPFCINLPLNLGPPPYLSKQACIRYVLCPTAHIKIGDRPYLVRQTWSIQMLTIYDPEKALASLPSPLVATDSIAVSQTPAMQIVKLTAGLHRQTWVNGGTIFVDVHVVNRSARILKKIDIQLEKTTLWYSHPAAGTAEKSASHLRLPKRRETEIVSTASIKRSKGWKGVASYASEVRTCELHVPHGHATISTGRYFEIRYFVNIIVSVSIFKSCSVQLPITLIHMNSLDILPNSLAQVAASIEAKRKRTVPVASDSHQPYYQGQAFTEPRRQSLDQDRTQSGIRSNEISLLTQDLNASPRRYRIAHGHHHSHQSGSASNENIRPRPSDASAAHHHHRHHPSCYHCHLLYHEQTERPDTATSRAGPRLPRLQVSTSGLGFSESEFEVPADSPPRKVMLSEGERKMIAQQKELKMQRELREERKKKSLELVDPNRPIVQPIQRSWKNVAVDSEPKSDFDVFDDGPSKSIQLPPMHRSSSKQKGKAPVRNRSKTDPVVSTSLNGPPKHPKGGRSMDSTRRATQR